MAGSCGTADFTSVDDLMTIIDKFSDGTISPVKKVRFYKWSYCHTFFLKISVVFLRHFENCLQAENDEN